MNNRIHMPRQAEEIIEKLNQHGYEAFIVGGCVRDSLMGRMPEDWDITTSATPQQVKAVFGRTIDTGIQHGTVTIMRGKIGYEVTTYRIDGEYEDGRHPKSVAFTPNLEEDLKRRDFTINAMAYSHRTGLVDIFGGMEDLESGMIRCVGRAADRFTEDALRILRALRFSAQLGFAIEPDTQAAIRELAPNLVHVSKERIQMELSKLLLSGHPGDIRHLFSYGISPYVSETFPALDPETIFILPTLPAEKAVRWAAVLRHLSPQDAGRILKELKLDNDTIGKAKLLVQFGPLPVGQTETEIRRTMSRMSEADFDSLLAFKEAAAGEGADGSGPLPGEAQTGDRRIGPNACPETLSELAKIRQMTAEIRRRGDCISLKTLAVTGGDLIRMGMKPGKLLGDTLSRLLQLVLEEPEKNQKEILLNIAEEWM